MNATEKKFLDRFTNDTIACMIVDIQNQKKEDDSPENSKLIRGLWDYLEKRSGGITGIGAFGIVVETVKDARKRLEQHLD